MSESQVESRNKGDQQKHQGGAYILKTKKNTVTYIHTVGLFHIYPAREARRTQLESLYTLYTLFLFRRDHGYGITRTRVWQEAKSEKLTRDLGANRVVVRETVSRRDAVHMGCIELRWPMVGKLRDVPSSERV